jgi:hypothetical protein
VGTDTPPRPVGRRPSPWVPTTPPRAKPFCAKAKGLCTRHIIFFKKNYSLIPLTHTHLPVLSKVKKQPLTIYRLTSAIHVVTLHPQTKQNLLTMQNSIYHKHQLHPTTVGPCQGVTAADTSLSRHKKSPTRAQQRLWPQDLRVHGPRPYQKISRRLNTSANPTVHCGEPTVLCGEPTPTPMQGGY